MWAGVPRMSPRNPKCSEAKNFHPSALCSGKSRRDYPGRLGTCSCPHANLTRAHSMRTILSFRYIGSSPSCSESAISNAKIPFRGPELERGRHLQIRRIARLLDAIYLLSRSSPGNRAPPDFCHRVKLSASNSSLISTILFPSMPPGASIAQSNSRNPSVRRCFFRVLTSTQSSRQRNRFGSFTSSKSLWPSHSPTRRSGRLKDWN